MQTDTRAHAASLHRQAIVIDGHCDILIPITDRKMRLGERLDLPSPDDWQPPLGLMESAKGFMATIDPHSYFFGGAGQYSIPQLLDGGVTVQVCTIFLEDRHLERALARGLEMAWWLHKEVDDNDNLELVTRVADIKRIKQERKVGALLSFEGFEALGSDLRFLDLYEKLGLRMAGLTHNRRNLFADGLQGYIKTGGLTELGKQAVRRMNELGIVIDLAHMNHVGFWEILQLTEAPVVLSHTSSRKLFPLRAEDSAWHPARNVSLGRERLEALANNGGVMGVIFYGMEDINDLVGDIEYVMELVGPDHIALGSDYYGLVAAPKGLEDISKLPRLTEALVQRGHSDETILKFLSGNYLRVFEQVWGG